MRDVPLFLCHIPARQPAMWPTLMAMCTETSSVDNRADVTVKFLHHVKNSTEMGIF